MENTLAPAIENRIFTIRGKQVMVDRDVAELFQLPTKRLNEQVKRNVERFPAHYFFRLTKSEKQELVANCDRLSGLKHSTAEPLVFTEHGISMLATLIKNSKQQIQSQITLSERIAFLFQQAAQISSSRIGSV